MSGNRAGNSVKVTDEADMDVNITTGATRCIVGDLVMYENVFTGTPTGSFSWEGSLDPEALRRPDEVTWTPLTVVVIHGTGNPAGAAGSTLVLLRDVPEYVRQKYIDVSSAASDKLTTRVKKRE